MKKINSIILLTMFLGFLFTLNSCEKVIEVKINDADQRIVVEAKLSNQEGGATVKLSKTLPLNSSNNFELVSGAEVYMIDMQTNERFMLNESEQGTYENQTLAGIPNRTYRLEIILTDGQRFTAQDTMPGLVTLDGVRFEEQDNAFFQPDQGGDKFYKLIPEFQDTEGVENFYQLFVVRGRGNNESNEDGFEINVFKDLGFDGLPNTQSVYLEAYVGETIKVELQNISESSYDYLSSLAINLSQSSGTPTNPETNIEGGALGYFKIYTTSGVLEAVVPE